MVKWILGAFIFVLLLIPVGGFYVLNYGNPILKYMPNKYVPEYLQKRGYSKDELAQAISIDPNTSINRDYHQGQYMVRFTDDPHMTYYYGVSKKGKKVVQFCERDWSGPYNGIEYYDGNNKSKHSETTCVNAYDNK